LESLEALVTLFWGDPMQLMFDQQFKVTEHPAFVAETDHKICGFIFYTPFQRDAVLIVALGVLPQFQGCGIGRDLIAHVEKYAKEHERQLLFVVTTNDNLPALAFYQRVGFQLFEVISDVVSQKLGGSFPGFANIPIRDELRLRKQVG
jgi:ribosomal protein S18 acetylase RimI-like enzyme